MSGVIDRSLNYGRHHIARFVGAVARESRAPGQGSPVRVLDIGAGHGVDLLIARERLPGAELYAIEVYPAYQAELRRQGIEVAALNIERDRFPFENESLDVVIAN